MKAANKYIALLICSGLLLKNTPCNAQQTHADSTKNSTTALLVIGGVLAILWIAGTIKQHSSKEFRNFKREINTIDNILANKTTSVKNIDNTRTAFANAEKYYSLALNDSRSNKTKLSERRQYFDRQKKTLSEYLKDYYTPQYNTFKNQFFENIAKYNIDVSHEILYNKIMPLLNDWKRFDDSFDTNYFSETQTMDKILSNSSIIQKKRSETFETLNAFINY